MKKLTSFALLSVALLSALAGCGKSDSADAAPEVKASDNSRLSVGGSSTSQSAQSAPTQAAGN